MYVLRLDILNWERREAVTSTQYDRKEREGDVCQQLEWAMRLGDD